MRSRNSGLESSGRFLDGALRRFKRFSLCNWQDKANETSSNSQN